ncbi:MAG: flagellar biosynthesis anti-sigma factor FlgM [Pseudomonadales bacterium]|jgi:negative regulator of flagellin synthesis FlgM
MKIDGMDPRPAGTIPGASNAPVDARPQTVGADTVATGGEGTQRPNPVAITSDAQALNDAAERINQTPAVSQARVDAVRSALERGEYVVDATRVAERIVELEDAF